MSVKIDPEGPRRSKKDPVRLRKLRQTSQAAFAASNFSSWLPRHLDFYSKIQNQNCHKLGSCTGKSVYRLVFRKTQISRAQ